MSNIEGVFSLRLVIADFYLEKPAQGLDPCYSEFRGREIKRVPIIRIFGSNGQGQKTCMHVHGVFPYFYIPYEKKDFESLNKAIYQIAFNVDKAINISLGQGSSTAQHIFKIQLVKGIPFYGYHRAEHQFLKIYMFNPRFVRRAANLLQNGAILGKNFHPHESHVPYILQFMIDYNLYGMSLLHVPIEVIKFRRNNDEEVIPFADLHPAQILSVDFVKKQSISTLEIDIGSNFILNRFQLVTKSNSTHTNPGIEAIWHDERLRRQKLALDLDEKEQEKGKAIPPLEIPVTQERPNVQPTESEIFYRTALLSRLLSMEESYIMMGSGSQADQTMNCSLQSNITNTTLNATNQSTKEQKRTFNLKKLLANAVYPEECTQEDQLTNASCIENHLSNNSVFQTSLMGSNTTQAKNVASQEASSQLLTDDSVFMDDTVLDEELVLSLTQPQHVPLNASLREEDMQLLDVLQQLEDNVEHAHQIDLDSSLAPMSQQHKNFDLSPELLDKESAAAATHQQISDNESESENDADGGNVHDFSIAMDDIDELLLKLTQPSQPPSQPTSAKNNLPQVDGSDDLLLRTPTKSTRKSANKKPPSTPPRSPRTPQTRGIGSPTRSPRTPKSNVASKYAPLPLIITNKSAIKNQTTLLSKDTTPEKSSLDSSNLKSSRGVSLRKTLALSEIRRKSISVSNELRATDEDAVTSAESSNTLPRRSRRTVDLDKTHITCALTPRSKKERILKVYTPDKNSKAVPNPQTNLGKESLNCESTETTVAQVEEVNKKIENPIRRSARVQTKNKNLAHVNLTQPSQNYKNLVANLEILKSTLDTANVKTTSQTNVEVVEVVEVVEDEEILASDNESDERSLRKTPNLKRLRRSFQTANLLKRKRLTKELTSTEEIVCNSSKFANNEKDSFNLESTKPEESKNSDLCKATVQETYIEDDTSLVKSCYEKSFSLNSPSIFSEVVSPLITAAGGGGDDAIATTISLELQSAEAVLDRCCSSDSNVTLSVLPMSIPHSSGSSTVNSGIDAAVIVTPLDLPPTNEEVLAGCRKFEIYEHEFQKPYYSNPDDITKQKEIGFTVLQIPGNKLNDLDEFKSVLGAEVKGLTDYRRRKMLNIGGSAMLNRYRNAQRIREYFADQRRTLITPQAIAPTRLEAKLWLKARELVKSKNTRDSETNERVTEDSPIKIRRQKVTMMLNDDAAGTAACSDEDMNCSSLTLTPMTPSAVSPLKESGETENQLKHEHTNTPCTTISTQSADSVAKSTSKYRRHTRRRITKTSLNEQLKSVDHSEEKLSQSKAIINELILPSGSSDEHKLSQASSLQKLQTSDTSIASIVALDALNRSSFVRNLESGTSSGQQHDMSFGLSSATLDNTFGFKVNLENLQQAKSDVEVYVPTRDDLYPNPEMDPIRCIFYAVENSIPTDVLSSVADSTKQLSRKACGYIIVNDDSDILSNEGKVHGIDSDIIVQVVRTELAALESLLELCALWDPDIYAGYEIEMSSWGFVIERAKYLCLNIGPLLSRVPTQKMRDFVDEDRDQFTDLDIEMKLCGRILLDVWRLMRSEIALTSYTFENVMYHILHKRCPWHSYHELTNWFASPCSRWIVIEYYLERVRGTLSLLDQLDLIGRTSEMAKLIGIQFYEVLSRGSQFRVESMMLRIAKPKNLVPFSPSVQQRAHMRAPEYLALIMEPQSRFYADPLIVLDFQSLYPSMIIAYNYCFSTCLGRVEHLGQSGPFEFAASQLRVSPTMLRKLLDSDLITISPCGVVFVKAAVREGILPRMLTEILDTRQMVKQSMKLHKSNTALQRILHSRQLGLKLMANVTYGYTAANFSGRMPAVEVGDTVVSKGRETLERAIKMVQSNAKWNVQVVYGDTDSMFVLVPGRTREQAFRIGEEIAEAVTQANPQPVKLKLEKVYQPCILQTKKRYVGYMYETPDQTEPIYEAKGIETVRRDGCPAVAKMLEKVLRILFETADVSQVKQYVCRQFTKLLSGRANIQDLIFAKEFRGLNGYKPTACVPALELTRKWQQTDPRRIPRRGERVPFIITNGPPGVPLIRLIRHPHEVLSNEGLKINAIYYITKAIIPPLNRCLLLLGADVNEWFTNLPRKILLTPALSIGSEVISAVASSNPNALVSAAVNKKSTISQYFSTTACIIECGRQTKAGICADCSRNATKTFVTLYAKIAKIERGYQLTQQICQACIGRVGDLKCGSLDCPVLYVLEVKRRDLRQITHFRNLLEERF